VLFVWHFLHCSTFYDNKKPSTCYYIVFVSLQTYSGPETAVLVRSPSKDASLSSHPARKFVMDFLRVIVVDSLSLPVSGKGPPAIDLVLDASPDTASMAQQTRFQTEVLGTLMEHLLAADVLIGEQAALPVVPGGSPQYIAPNVCYLAARIVDKLWQGDHHIIHACCF